jgi:hypothetical protein
MRQLELVVNRMLGTGPTVIAGLIFYLSLARTAAAVDIVPEVDPGSMASALTLLAGGGLLLAHRLRRKKSS